VCVCVCTCTCGSKLNLCLALEDISFSKIHIGFTFLVPAHLDSPRKKGPCWCWMLELRRHADLCLLLLLLHPFNGPFVFISVCLIYLCFFCIFVKWLGALYCSVKYSLLVLHFCPMYCVSCTFSCLILLGCICSLLCWCLRMKARPISVVFLVISKTRQRTVLSVSVTFCAIV